MLMTSDNTCEMCGDLTSVNAENLVVDDDAQRQKIKHVGKIMPYIGIAILSRTFGIKSI